MKLLIKCPKCGCEEFIYDDWYYDEEEAWRQVECSKCDSIWNWVFTFSYNEDIKTGMKIDPDNIVLEPPK